MKRYLLFLFALTIAAGCQYKPSANGASGSLVVVADSVDRPLLSKVLDRNFGKEILTPQPETRFKMIWADGKTLADNMYHPQILLLAPLNGTGPTAELLNKMLTPGARQVIESGQQFIITKKDPWARGQRLYILTAATSLDLALRTAQWSDTLFAKVYDRERERIGNDLLRVGENSGEEQRVFAKHHFHIRIPHDFSLEQDNDSLRFVRWIRYIPERWLMIQWGELSDSSALTGGFILRQRQISGACFPDPVVTDSESVSVERTTFAGRPAILVRGLWQTVSHILGGGPFFSYGVWIAEERRYYIVDCAVFAPGKEKMPFLWQMDIMAHSFVPADNREK